MDRDVYFAIYSFLKTYILINKNNPETGESHVTCSYFHCYVFFSFVGLFNFFLK